MASSVRMLSLVRVLSPVRVLRVSAGGGQGGAGGPVYRTVQDAVDAVPLNNTVHIRIEIEPGVYRQPVYVPKTKNFITFAGSDRPENTVLTWNNTAKKIVNPQPPSVIGTGTFGCGSVIVDGEDFIADNITFENSAPQNSGQAVALRVSADRCAFNNCRFLGWQDTLYSTAGRHYLKDCYIEGNTDFVCGDSTALLEHCQIYCKCKSGGVITAQKREVADESTGYVFLRCTISGNGSPAYSYLGRPWGWFARVVFAYTCMDKCINPAGWQPWDGERKNPYYAEYRCSGPGSDRSQRVRWSRELDDEEAQQFLTRSFIEDPKSPWVPRHWQ